MKKTRIILLTLLLLALVSCGSSSKGLSAYSGGVLSKSTLNHADGTYHGIGDLWEYGNEDALFTIENGALTSINLRKLGFDGSEVNYADWNGQNGRPDLDSARKELADKMIKAQSFDVPNVPGAAQSCDNWKVALRRAIKIGAGNTSY